MKSRKSGLFGKRTPKRAAAAPTPKSTLRRGVVETLEPRQLLAGDWGYEAVRTTGVFLNAESRAAGLEYLAQKAGGGSGGQGNFAGPEGGASDIINLSEIEPNTSFGSAQLVPLQGNLGVNIVGGIANVSDVDWFAFDLEAGDILDGRLSGGASSIANLPLLSLHDATGRELVASQGLPTAPADSPLTGSPSAPSSLGDVALHYIIPTNGRYFMRVSDVLSSYNLALRQYRSTYEAEPAGTKQILFLDFDGATVNRNIFNLGVPGSARMAPLSSFLAGYNLQASDEDAFIDSIVRSVQSRFDTLAMNTTNPDFGLEIRNSKDHADPWGQANVSRIIVGGTEQELFADPASAIGIFGIAESVDFGNFDRTETALVMQDAFLSLFNTVPVSGGATQLDAIAEIMATTIVHEAGHYFGAAHQLDTNNIISLMDVGRPLAVSAGAGIDGIFGTVDDVKAQFGVDAYVAESFLAGGVNDSINTLGWGLTTGQAGGRITGTIYQDNNLSRAFDAGDIVLPGTRVYADLNGNSVMDAGEFSTLSDAAGNYSLLVPAGSYIIREVVPAGFRLTSPANNAVAATVGLNGTVGNINFGQERLDRNFTGVKWNDANANGLRDTGEATIAGVYVYIDLDGDNRIDLGEPSVQTDEFGNYKLQFPGPGTYTIREVVDPGYVQTFPGAASGFEHTVTITGDPVVDADRIAGLNFGNTLTVDFGDAPATYGVASHGFVPGLRLGVNWDAEQASQHSSNALGDDNNGAVDDEDGVTLVRPLVPGTNQVSVVANNTTGAAGYVNAWIDFNQNGVFDATEKVIADRAVGTGTSSLTFTAPANAALGNTFARFRYSNELGVGPTGVVGSGEVEDYVFQVVADREFTIDDPNESVSRNSVQNTLDVLANDFKLPGETLTILSFSSTTAGGTVSLGAGSASLLYTPPSGFIGQDTFTYTAQNSFGDIGTATVTVDVRLFFANPVAIDDSFDVAEQAVDFPLNVLSNDIEGQNGALTIVSVGQTSAGGSVSIATGGKSLRYTPVRGFGSTETFSYTVADAAGNQSTAEVTLHALPGDRDDDVVLIKLEARDTAGNLITAIPQGESFVIDLVVDDLRFDAANPGVAAGVFAAYADVLYDLQLVSTTAAQPGSGFNFDVEFFNNFTNGRLGDGSIPGIIDDFGAFLTNTATISEPDPVKLASITFEARSPGVARFFPDPADNPPQTDTLLFNTSSSAIPTEQIRYIGTSLEIIGDGAVFPVAVDDSLTAALPVGAVNVPINVLANDLPGSTGSISILDFQSLTGNAEIRLNAAGNGLLYTPRSDFQGTDQFEYRIQDASGRQSGTAVVTLRVGNADANDIVNLRLQATDAAGNPIDQITVGSNFQLRGFVQDLRTVGANLGVFAAYEDILYSSQLVSVIENSSNGLGFEVSFGPNFQRVREGDVRTLGVINEIGAVATSDDPLGNGEQLLFTINLTANNLGTANFIADPADISPLHDTLTYQPVEVVGVDRIRYGFDSLTIVSASGSGSGEGFHNGNMALDVNDDGFVSPIDALTIINRLNSGNSGPLGGSGEGESGLKQYVDTNNDGHLSPVDALLVINFLNANGGGEGEGADLLASYLSGGVDAPATTWVALPAALQASPEELSDSKPGSIAARTTSTAYGPAAPVTSAEAFFDVSDADEDDDLLNQLAADVESTWHKRLQ